MAMKELDIAKRIYSQFDWTMPNPGTALANMLWRVMRAQQVHYLIEDHVAHLAEIAEIGDMLL